MATAAATRKGHGTVGGSPEWVERGGDVGEVGAGSAADVGGVVARGADIPGAEAGFVVARNAQAEAWAYLRGNSNSNDGGNGWPFVALGRDPYPGG